MRYRIAIDVDRIGETPGRDIVLSENAIELRCSGALVGGIMHWADRERMPCGTTWMCARAHQERARDGGEREETTTVRPHRARIVTSRWFANAGPDTFVCFWIFSASMR